ncbi:MAG: ribonuclease H [Acidimicrobiia bacterium]
MFTCQDCGKEFEMRQDLLDRYPGWTPRQCLDCRNAAGPVARGGNRSKSGGGGRSVTKSRDLTVAEVLDTFTEGPDTGVFTDGASEGNPGPGGWGAVHVVAGEIRDEARGSEDHTTNNKMELTAMVAGLKMLSTDAQIPVYTDSQLVVNIITKWADGWKTRGWTKKSTGPIANLELVKEAHALYKARPGVELVWIRAHSGSRWNEYADSLATSYRRQTH